MLLLQYEPVSGAMLGAFESSDQTLLEAQIDTGVAGVAYVLSDEPITAWEAARYWYVVGGVATPKTAVEITATPNPFDADSVATCTVTVDPFQACVLVVDGVDAILTPLDPTLVLTSDVPHTFLINLASLPDAWAPAITVEAV